MIMKKGMVTLTAVSYTHLFLGFLLSPQAQADIAKNNVMLPVVETDIESHIDALNSRAKSIDVYKRQPQ